VASRDSASRSHSQRTVTSPARRLSTSSTLRPIPLRASGELYALEFEIARVTVTVEFDPGTEHGHFNEPYGASAQQTLEQITCWLKNGSTVLRAYVLQARYSPHIHNNWGQTLWHRERATVQADPLSRSATWKLQVVGRSLCSSKNGVTGAAFLGDDNSSKCMSREVADEYCGLLSVTPICEREALRAGKAHCTRHCDVRACASLITARGVQGRYLSHQSTMRVCRPVRRGLRKRRSHCPPDRGAILLTWLATISTGRVGPPTSSPRSPG
jgi:hypothetical protein